MKKFLLTSAFALLGWGVIAQTADTAKTGAGYLNDVYYSMKYGTVSTSANSIWDLAFQIMPLSGPNASVSILGNHYGNNVRVYSLGRKASQHFSSLTANDTLGALGNPLHNNPETWSEGALNANADASNPFDYGWGVYDMTSHDVLGDSLYLIRTGSGVNEKTYKLTVQKFNSTPTDSIYYEFRVANFDNTDDTTIRLYRKDGFVDRAFAFFNLASKTAMDRELVALGEWDILFTKTVDYVMAGPSPVLYNVTSVLSAPGVEVAQEGPVNPSAAVYNSTNLSDELNVIGYDWKSFDNSTFSWTVDSTISYFVKTATTPSEIYQLWFTAFGGTANGHYVFNKKLVGNASSVKEMSSNLTTVNVFPNPAQHGQFSLVMEAKEASEQSNISIVDMSGRVVRQYPVRLRKGLNALKFQEQLPSGTYIINIRDAQSNVNVRLSVPE